MISSRKSEFRSGVFVMTATSPEPELSEAPSEEVSLFDNIKTEIDYLKGEGLFENFIGDVDAIRESLEHGNTDDAVEQIQDAMGKYGKPSIL